MSQPLDKGRVVFIAEQYQSNDIDQQTGQPKMKNRYANAGRATLWPSENGSQAPNVQIEIDAMPMGHTGKLKLSIFWDSDRQDAGAQQQAPQQQHQQQGYQQQPQQGYQQPR